MRFDLPTMDEIRGLSAPPAAGVPTQLPVDDIDEDPEQPRREFDEESLTQLAATIAGRGVRQPVSVRRHPERPGRWMLNFGARRLRAARLAGEATIAAFEDAAPDSYDQVIENEQREGLKPVELALFIKRQLDRGQSRADIARAIGKSKAYITYACSLIDPPGWLIDVYRSGKCRGLFELHELRRLHDTNADAVETMLAESDQVGRTEVKLLNARIAEAMEAKAPNEASPRGGASVAGNSMPDTSELPPIASRPGAAGRAEPPASRPSPDRAGQQLTTRGRAPVLRPSVAHRLAVCARHDGAIVRVVLDDVPSVPSSVFVLSRDGARFVVSLDSLVRVELVLDASPQP